MDHVFRKLEWGPEQTGYLSGTIEHRGFTLNMSISRISYRCFRIEARCLELDFDTSSDKIIEHPDREVNWDLVRYKCQDTVQKGILTWVGKIHERRRT